MKSVITKYVGFKYGHFRHNWLRKREYHSKTLFFVHGETHIGPLGRLKANQILGACPLVYWLLVYPKHVYYDSIHVEFA